MSILPTFITLPVENINGSHVGGQLHDSTDEEDEELVSGQLGKAERQAVVA